MFVKIVSVVCGSYDSKRQLLFASVYPEEVEREDFESIPHGMDDQEVIQLLVRKGYIYLLPSRYNHPETDSPQRGEGKLYAHEGVWVPCPGCGTASGVFCDAECAQTWAERRRLGSKS